MPTEDKKKNQCGRDGNETGSKYENGISDYLLNIRESKKRIWLYEGEKVIFRTVKYRKFDPGLWIIEGTKQKLWYVPLVPTEIKI